jgi:hypothetical protein
MLMTELAAPFADSNNLYTMPLSTQLTVPLALDELSVNGQILPRAMNTSLALPPLSTIHMRLNNATIAFRLVFHEYSNASGFKTVNSVTPVPMVPVNSAAYEYALQWQVDSQSWFQGYGRLIIAHKKSTDPNAQPYHVAHLWAGGLIRTNDEFNAFVDYVQQIPITSSFTFKGGW